MFTPKGQLHSLDRSTGESYCPASDILISDVLLACFWVMIRHIQMSKAELREIKEDKVIIKIRKFEN